MRGFQKTILEWFEKNGRHDLPWRPPALKFRRDGTCNPYKVFVSEVMLQQTQVHRVVGCYTAFLKKFPTVEKLAETPPSEVLKVWKGLGYNRRALYLKRAAGMIVRDFRGRFPHDVDDIEKLPGVGHYTARAVSVFAFNTPEVFIETNIRRVFIHFFFSQQRHPEHPYVIPNAVRNPAAISRKRRDPSALPQDDRNYVRDDVSDAELIPIIHKALYKKNPRMWYNALMDYGALALDGITNPNRRSRHYVKQSRFEGSRRYARAKILDALLKSSALSESALQKLFLTDTFFEPYRERTVFSGILSDLEREGFIEREGLRWRLRKT